MPSPSQWELMPLGFTSSLNNSAIGCGNPEMMIPHVSHGSCAREAFSLPGLGVSLRFTTLRIAATNSRGNEL